MGAPFVTGEGAPTPNDGRSYATTLAQIGSDGSVRSAAELFPREAGTEWIGFSYDRRQALIFSLQANSAQAHSSGLMTNQQFTTYLMYMPPGNGSIYVTLNTLNWNWAAVASLQGGTWTVPSAQATYSQNPTGANSTALPIWSNSIPNVP